MKIQNLFLGFSLIFGTTISSWAQSPNMVESIKILPTDSHEQIIEKASKVIPSTRQYDWQQLEFIAFTHFGVNTFNRVEWGTGKEDPKIFNPVKLDATQWVKTMKAAGMKMVMLTAKHHDGFCLWQTATTDFSVKSSPWKKGKGDVLREVVNAAHAEGLKVGVYVSPADLNQIERKDGFYGNHSTREQTTIPSLKAIPIKDGKTFTYDLTDYDEFFMNQLYEVLTEYGKIEEIWFDGANPHPGTGQTYNRSAWYDMIRKLQPTANVAIDGLDVRWCGNEAGHTRKTEWSVIPFQEDPNTGKRPDGTQDDLGSREKLFTGKYLNWYPAETNTSIRAGWFYRDEKQNVRTVDNLVDTWYRSVGGNTVFLLNLTPNRDGLIPEKDATRLREMGNIIRKTFAHNLIDGAKINATSEQGHATNNMLDHNIETAWKPNDGTTQVALEVNLKEETTFNRLLLQECIKSYGQRIEKFKIDAWINNTWKEISDGTVVGYKKICRFEDVKTDRLRIRIEESRVAPTLSNIGIYKAEAILSPVEANRSKDGKMTLTCATPETEIYYTTNGEDPSKKGKRYTAPFDMSQGGVLKVKASTIDRSINGEVYTSLWDLAPTDWTVVKASSKAQSNQLANIVDGNPNTLWQGEGKKGKPQSVIIDLNNNILLKGFTYTPRQDGAKEGLCNNYTLEVSTDGKHWTQASSGRFDNIENNPVVQEIRFYQPHTARYLKFIEKANIKNDASFSIAEIGVITQ